MKIKPLNEWLLVRIKEVEATTQSGLYLSDAVTQDKQSQNEATIVEANEGSDFKKGDQIIFQRFSGEEIEVDGEWLRFISESSVLALTDY